MSTNLKLDPMTDIILGTVAEATAPLLLENSRLRAWASQDKRKIRSLFDILVRVDGVLATLGVVKKSPIRVSINNALK